MASIRNTIKRAMDVLLASTGLLFLSIPLVLTALAVKVDSEGPSLFRQTRLGRDEERFRIWKFRTMVTEAPDQGFKREITEDNPHITRVGSFLREWGLDELPQLINVLTGEMSLVGPRPCLPWQADEMDDRQRRRFKVKPGITSLSVIEGRNSLSWQDRIERDLAYVRDQSLTLDLKILLKTPWVVLVKREGVYGEGGEHSLASEDESETGKNGMEETADA